MALAVLPYCRRTSKARVLRVLGILDLDFLEGFADDLLGLSSCLDPTSFLPRKLFTVAWFGSQTEAQIKLKHPAAYRYKL